MTWSKDVTLWCDGDRCQEWGRFNASRVDRAVEKARERGWSSPEWDVHLCPDCSQLD